MKAEVWVYEDFRSEGKRRPCLIVGDLANDQDVLVANITTAGQRSGFDVPVENWEQAGFKKPSWIRSTKLYSIQRTDLLYRVAKLDESDMLKVKAKIAEYIFC